MSWNHQYFYKEKKIVALDLPAYASGTPVLAFDLRSPLSQYILKGFLMLIQHTSASVR